MSTENPWVSNFRGLGGFWELVERTKLMVDDGQETSLLDGEAPSIRLDPNRLDKLGLQVALEAENAEFVEAAEVADLELDDIIVYVIGEDRFLKERDVLVRTPASEWSDSVILAERSGDRPRSLMNSVDGFFLEVAVVLGDSLPLNPGRPHRLGTKLAWRTFRVHTWPEFSGLAPVELTDDIRREHGLSKKTSLYVEVADDLLSADELQDAITVYVDEKLLELLDASPSNAARDHLEERLAIEALQQLTHALSRELAGGRSGGSGSLESSALDLIHGKLCQVSPVGNRQKPTRDESITMIRDKPEKVSALLTGLSNHSANAIKMLQSSDPEAVS